MATEAQAKRLRRDVGYDPEDDISFTQMEVDDLFTEAEEMYSDPIVSSAYTRILYLQGLLASSAKLSSYRQNSTSENLSDVFKHVKDLYDLWWDKFASIEKSSFVDGAVRSGRQSQLPTRLKEYPNS